MQLVQYTDAIHLRDMVYVGEYKGRNAFVHMSNGVVKKIVLDDASHFYGSDLYQIDYSQLCLFIDDQVAPMQENKELLEKQRIIDEQWARIRDLEADKDTAERHCKSSEKYLLEKTERHDAQLRSVFYLLDQLENIGTHHEKAVVVGYIRKCIAGFLKQDKLDHYHSDDLPF